MAMNTDQWRDCSEMWLMLTYINLNASDRKKRLLAASLCRNVARFIVVDRCDWLLKQAKVLYAFGGDPVPEDTSCLLRAIDQAEKFADGLISVEDLTEVSHIADRLSFVTEYYYACREESWGPTDFDLIASSDVAAAIHSLTRPSVDIEQVSKAAACAVNHAAGNEESNRMDKDEEAAQCNLVRDLLPNPDCLYTADSSWITPSVVDLAQSIYHDGGFDQLPNLGKALRDAGCDDESVLSHCDDSRLHVRGCWVVDAILGQE